MEELRYVLSERGKEIQQDVLLEEILVLPEFQPRKSLDFGLVEILKMSEHIPAIKLAYFPEKYGNKLVLIDGNHRYKSRVESEETINAHIFKYETDLDIFKDATKANICHGKMLTKEERQTSIAKIIECIPSEKFSATALADELGGQDRREIRKISCWVEIKRLVGEKRVIKLNVSKADILYRLIKDGKMSTEEFIDFFDRYSDFNFNALNDLINKKLNNEEIQTPTELAINTLDKIEQEIDELEQELGVKVEEQEMKFIEDSLKTEEINVDIVVKNIFGETKQALKILKSFKTEGKFKTNETKQAILKEINSIKEVIKELEEGLE